MPSLRPVERYPAEYSALFLKACKEEVRVECASEEEARNFRARLYTFRSALFARPDHAPRVTLIAPLVKIRLEGAVLCAYPDESVKQLQEALNNA